MPLSMNLARQPFEKWGIDFVGPISLTTCTSQARYIKVAIDYFTKWVEARATCKANARSTAKFLYEQVISYYGCPLKLISDRGSYFLNEVIAQLTSQFLIIHRKCLAYYPQANGQGESKNKKLCQILTKTVEANRSDWEHKLTVAFIRKNLDLERGLVIDPLEW